MAEKVRVHFFVAGKVQGVFFRSETKEKAQQLGLTGWVKNLADGRVEIVAEGERGRVEELVNWAKRGPAIARVNGLDVDWQEYQGEFENFEIKYD